MEDRERVAIGTVVMRNKQYLTAVRPLDGALAMSTMRFADEVVPRSDIDGLPTRRTKPDAKALRLATQIVDSLEAPWKPEQYEDTYTAELERIIRAKDKGEDVVVEASPAATADVVDLMAALEASVDAARSGRGRRGRASALRKATEELAAAADAEADEQPAKRKGGTGRQAGRRKKSA